jgi:hypothetical protein
VNLVGAATARAIAGIAPLFDPRIRARQTLTVYMTTRQSVAAPSGPEVA